nr:MAG TPA: Spindle Pole Component 29 [Caudoviricetes sp.]
MQTLETQLQAAAAIIQEQQAAIEALKAKADTQGSIIMQQQLANFELQQKLTELSSKVDVIGQLAMQQALPDVVEGGETDV